jgi:hypothetical protein
MERDEKIADALKSTLETWNPDQLISNYENANVVDGLFAIARSIRRLADAVEKLNERYE